MRNRRGGCCSSWLARWGRFCRWSAAEGEGRAGNDAGWAMETGIFWPAWWGAAGLRRAASGSVRAGRRIRLWRAAVRRRRVVTSLPASAAGVSPEAGAPHRVRLEGTTWGVWRDMCLRSAGFPADMVLAICDEALARSADLAGADPAGRLAYDQVYADAAGRLSRTIAGIYAHARFREAITWHNPGLAQFLHDHDAGPGSARSRK